VAMRYVEHRLELGRMGEEPPDEIRERWKVQRRRLRFGREAKGLVGGGAGKVGGERY